MFRCVLVLALATCTFAGYLGYGGYSMAAPWTSAYSTVHHAPAVSSLGYGHGLGYGYGLGYGHGLGYGYGMSGLGYGYGMSGLGYGYGLGRLGYGGIYKKCWKKRTLTPGTVPSQNLPLRPLDKPPKLRQPLTPRASVDKCKPRTKDDLPAAVTLAELNSEEDSTSEGLVEQDLPNQDADAADPIGLQAELHSLKKDVGSQADTLQLEKDQVLGIARVKDEPALVSLTCIPTFQLFYNICDLYGESRILNQRKDFSISNEDAVLLTMMKLYHNLTFSLLGVLFGVHRTTASNIFRASVPVLAAVLRHAVFWPEKEAVLQSLTKYFNKYRDCRMVLDCTEIPLQKPKNLESQLLTYSHYKGTHTAKVLVCETPGGLISYVS
ncbi:hypothetical protein HPB47_016390 [Ixodes persulcatus]|uniref:Uncharacterized protein n=1 Tax=Ixodes persulcatus TaxID=34615 RepID=A0AC60QR47_IXOPE|nr:hypothetical protein HPB47_016390 [Ixodes persulcatus]